MECGVIAKNRLDSNDIKRRRFDFPMLQSKMHGKNLVYLDTAATAQKPFAVIDTITNFYKEGYATVHRAVYPIAAHSSERYAEVRKRAQRFIGAEHWEEIIFTKGTTESLNLVAMTYGEMVLEKGDEVIVSVMEHHSNLVPWQMLAQKKGAVLRFIPMNKEGELDLSVYESLLSEKVKLVCVGHVSNVTGTIHPIKEIATLAHQYRAKVVVDGAQAAGHLSISVVDLDADFYAFSSHKMYGPTGVGILYGKKALLEAMPPYQGGGDMIEHVDLEGTTYQSPPAKFEAGTPSIAQVLGFGAAISYIEEVGLSAIYSWENKLFTYALKKIQSVVGLTVLGSPKQRSAILSFVVEGAHSLDLGTMLSLKGIAIRTGHLCAQPLLKEFSQTAVSRLSLGLYNSFEEVDYFVHCLQEAVFLLRPEISY